MIMTIIQREKRLDKFPDTFSEFKQHVSKFVRISDVAKELPGVFICSGRVSDIYHSYIVNNIQIVI